MVDTTAFINNTAFYSTYTTTILRSFFNIIPSAITYTSTNIDNGVILFNPSQYKMDIAWEEFEPYVIAGYFTFTNYSIIIIPTQNFDIQHQMIEIWMVNKNSPIIVNYTKYFMKRTLPKFDGTNDVDIYFPWCQSIMDIYGTTWTNTLTMNMVSII